MSTANPVHPVSPFLDITLPCGQTDIANARRFAGMHVDKLRYCHPWKKWLAWDGTRWRIDESGRAQTLAKQTCDRLWTEARQHGSDDGLKHAAKSAQGPRVKAMVELARDELAVSPSELDSYPWLLNCPNGTLDLLTGKLEPHDRDHLLTQLCPTDYNPSAPMDNWTAFIEGE